METYYTSTDLGFKKQTTEEYVRDPRFEVIGVSVQVDGGWPEWFSGTKKATKEWLSQFDWVNSMALAHNAMFDMAILNWHFDIRPKAIADTLSMARAIHGTEVGNSLAKLADYYKLGVKGTEVVSAIDLKREDFPPAKLRAYAEYCRNDVALTYDLFLHLLPKLTRGELKLIDLTIRMFTEPVLTLDKPLLQAHLADVRERKAKLMEAAGANLDDLMSNQKFAELLRGFGVEPPTKISPTTGELTLAMAKSDEGFKALAEHPDERVQILVAARLGNKTTLEETRTERLLGIADRGVIPVPLSYYAAHTGRWGGADKLNFQNFPSRGENAGKLKKAILAPEGHVMIDCDSSQIEARVLAWFAEQNDLVEVFENNNAEIAAGIKKKDMKYDPYKLMASAIYGKGVEDITDPERFVGKTTILGCLAEGTLVLCDSGWKPIEQVTLQDKLWDGEEWVCHQGLQNSGIKETLNLCGIWLTPDHHVWSGTQWLEAQLVVRDESTRSQALDIAAGNLPSQAMYGAFGEGYQTSSCSATATAQTTSWIPKTSKTSEVPAAPFVPKLRHTKNGIGCIQTHWLTTSIVPDCSIDWLLPSHAAIPQPIGPILTMGGVAYQFSNSGETTAPPFSGMFKHFRDGIARSLKWIGLMSTETMSRGTYDSSPAAITSKTSDGLQTLRRKLQTYDLAYAGPKNRYTVLTNDGPLIVHNCGYGMGAKKFQTQLKTFGVEISDEESARIINTYRETYPWIPALWKAGSAAIEAMSKGKTAKWGRKGVIDIQAGGILMPNGLYQRYPNLRKVRDKDGKEQYIYDSRKGVTKLYGGKLTENICQGLARCIIGEQMLRIAKRYKVVLTVHDAVACIAPEKEVEEAMAYVMECMRFVPEWAQGIPLNCEAGYGRSYGDC